MEEEEENKCIICFESFTDSEEYLSGLCKCTFAKFHKECLVEWVKENKKIECEICKTPRKNIKLTTTKIIPTKKELFISMITIIALYVCCIILTSMTSKNKDDSIGLIFLPLIFATPYIFIFVSSIVDKKNYCNIILKPLKVETEVSVEFVSIV